MADVRLVRGRLSHLESVWFPGDHVLVIDDRVPDEQVRRIHASIAGADGESATLMASATASPAPR